MKPANRTVNNQVARAATSSGLDVAPLRPCIGTRVKKNAVRIYVKYVKGSIWQIDTAMANKYAVENEIAYYK